MNGQFFYEWCSTHAAYWSRLCVGQFSVKQHLLYYCLKITKNVSFWFFQFWLIPPIFVLLKVTCLVTLFDCKLQVFKNSPKWSIFGIFNELFFHSKFKRSSLRSQCWMRPFSVIFKHCASMTTYYHKLQRRGDIIICHRVQWSLLHV